MALRPHLTPVVSHGNRNTVKVIVPDYANVFVFHENFNFWFAMHIFEFNHTKPNKYLLRSHSILIQVDAWCTLNLQSNLTDRISSKGRTGTNEAKNIWKDRRMTNGKKCGTLIAGRYKIPVEVNWMPDMQDFQVVQTHTPHSRQIYRFQNYQILMLAFL